MNLLRGEANTMRRLHQQHGQAAVEFILIFPFMLMLLLFIVEFGFILHAYISVVESAAAGARFAAVGNPPAAGSCTANDGTIQGRSVAVSSNTVACADVVVRYQPATPVARGDIVAVKVNKTYTTVTPIGGILTFLSLGTFPGTLAMNSCFDARLEQGPTVQTNVVVGAGCP